MTSCALAKLSQQQELQDADGKLTMMKIGKLRQFQAEFARELPGLHISLKKACAAGPISAAIALQEFGGLVGGVWPSG